MIEGELVAEKEGFVGGHGLDDFHRQRLGKSRLHFHHEFGNARKARLARERHQSAFDQILLVGRQIESGTLLQELPQELIIQRRHERSPENNLINFGAI